MHILDGWVGESANHHTQHTCVTDQIRLDGDSLKNKKKLACSRFGRPGLRLTSTAVLMLMLMHVRIRPRTENREPGREEKQPEGLHTVAPPVSGTGDDAVAADCRRFVWGRLMR